MKAGRRQDRGGGSEGRQALTVSIHLVDHVLQLGLCGVLTQRAHDCAQLFGGDGTVPIFVKE